jgi:hypothetical protein
MRFGLLCSAQANNNELGLETGQGFRDYLDFNVEAEALGYHSSFSVEHHFTGWNQVSATLTLLTCLAMKTTTLPGECLRHPLVSLRDALRPTRIPARCGYVRPQRVD